MDYLVEELLSPKGTPARLCYRDDTSDLATIGSTWNLWGKLEDEYGLATLPTMSGLAIDVGAHVGSVAFALLADHPDLEVIAVEPLLENVEVMRATAELNGWTDRIHIFTGGIAKGDTTDIAYDFAGDEYIKNHRYIGGMALGTETPHTLVTVPAVSLSFFLPDDDECEFLKHDCEGCEWALLDDPAVGRCKRIVGEGHPADWLERVHAALDATHDVHVIDDRGGPGTYWATRHPTERDVEDAAFARTLAHVKASHPRRKQWSWEVPR